jgi:hypothetical protein
MERDRPEHFFILRMFIALQAKILPNPPVAQQENDALDALAL